REIRKRQHRVDALAPPRGAGVYAADRGVSVGAAHERRLEYSGKGEIGDETAAAREQRALFKSLDGAADVLGFLHALSLGIALTMRLRAARALRSLRRLLLSPLRRPRPHGLGLKRAVAQVEIALEPVLALGFEQLLPELVVGRVRERAEGSFEQKAGINSGGLHAHHGNGLVEPHRRLRHKADAFGE